MNGYPFIQAHPMGVVLTLHVQPRSSRSAVVGIHGEALKVSVQQPPVDGAANDAICELLAEFFHLSKRDVEILSGEAGRHKRVVLRGVTAAQAEVALRSVVK